MCPGRTIADADFYEKLMLRAFEIRDLEGVNVFDAIERAHEELSGLPHA